MMEPVSFQGLRQRHINTTSDSTSKELTSDMPTMVNSENSPLHHDSNDEFMSDEITSTPFQTRAGSPSRGEIMPHTVAQATKFMSDLHAIVETDPESNTAAIDSNGSIASKANDKSLESGDGVPVPAAPVSAPKPHFFGLSNTAIFLIWLCAYLLMIPYIGFKHHDKVRTNPHHHLKSYRVKAGFDVRFVVSVGGGHRSAGGFYAFAWGLARARGERDEGRA